MNSTWPDSPPAVTTLFALTVVAASILAAGCTSSPAQSGATADVGPALADASASDVVFRGTFEESLLLTGSLEAVRSIAVKAPQTSVFQMRIQFMAEEGTQVEEGDPILTFDNSFFADQIDDLENRILDAETQIVSKENELASAKKDLEIEIAEKIFAHDNAALEASVDADVLAAREYAERLFEEEKTRRELADARARLALTEERGEAELDVLRINKQKLEQDLMKAREGLELFSIEAPASGLVVYERRPRTTLKFQEGDSCWPGTTIMRVPDLSEMKVVFDVNEVDAPLLSEGTKVSVSLDSFPGRSLTGTVTHIPSMAVRPDPDSNLRIFRVEATLDETWTGEMKPGMSALGEVVVERREDVLLAPRERVRRIDGEYRLYSDSETFVVVEPLARNSRHYALAETDSALAALEREEKSS
jgi:multidrug efflux pump subunit AcrA (membrane-fusion protein)